MNPNTARELRKAAVSVAAIVAFAYVVTHLSTVPGVARAAGDVLALIVLFGAAIIFL